MNSTWEVALQIQHRTSFITLELMSLLLNKKSIQFVLSLHKINYCQIDQAIKLSGEKLRQCKIMKVHSVFKRTSLLFYAWRYYSYIYSLIL